VGLPADVVADARSRLTEGHRETLEYAARLKDLAASREREEESLRRQREELEARRRELETTLASTIAGARQRWSEAIETALARIDHAREQFLSSIHDRAVALQVRAEARRESRSLRQQLEQVIEPLTPSPVPAAGAAHAIGPGTPVRLSGGAGAGQTATVESLDRKGRAVVMVRGKRVSVPLSELTALPPGAAAGRKLAWTLPAGVKFTGSDRTGAPAEINLIGATVEEATEKLDRFLDDAYLAGHSQVRVVHGHGTGRLRAAIHKMLETHPHVESRAAADERSGGTGATVVILRA